MNIECDELQEQIKESLLHSLLNWVCDIATSRQIIVIPGLDKLANRKLPEVIKVKRLYTEYEIFTDFPVMLLGLTPNEPIPHSIGSPLTFRWEKGEYYDTDGVGLITVWLCKKPKKSKK